MSARSGLRVGIFNLYWHTYGGGEQVSGAIAAQLARGSLTSPLGDKADTGSTRDAAKALLIDTVQRGFVQGARDADRTEKVSL